MMDLTLEEVVVLANTPKESASGNKSGIVLATQMMIQNPKIDFVVINKLVDDLTSNGFISKDGSSTYTLNEKGKKALKESYEAVQMLMLSIYTRIN